MAEIKFYREFGAPYGDLQSISPMIRRIVAPNPSPFTFHGTGTYVIGRGQVAVIDPGPLIAEHVDALLAALAAETVTHILVTHTHCDHSPAAEPLKLATGAPTFGFGPHTGSHDVGHNGEAADRGFVPDGVLRDGDVIEGSGWQLEVVHTPGHTSNHLCFALPEERALFSGDHVMGWSTSVIAPPDGNMTAYVNSLEKLLLREDTIYWPTHGPAVTEPKIHVSSFIAHRRERDAAILARLAAGDETIPAVVAAIYAGLDSRLHGAAGRSVLAHLLALIEVGLVACDEPPHIAARFRLQ